MQSRRTNNYHSKVLRRGLSVVEFVGCLVALCGGVTMGSMYLGVDLQGIATDVLEYSQVMDFQSAETDELASADTSEDQPTVDTEEIPNDQSPASETSDHADDISGDSEETVNTEASPEATAKLKLESTEELTEAERKKATQDYWKVLNACVRQETLGRKAGAKNFANWQLLDHLTHRLKGHQRVIDKIEQLDAHGVDPKVTLHANQVVAWHLAGVKLNQRALDLITNGPQASLTGPVAQSWQSAATQHRMEEKLVHEKHLGVASYLVHTYKTSGPAQPAASL